MQTVSKKAEQQLLVVEFQLDPVMIRIQGLSEGDDVFGGTLDENQRWDRRGETHMVIKLFPKHASASVRNAGAGTAVFALRVTRPSSPW